MQMACIDWWNATKRDVYGIRNSVEALAVTKVKQN